MRSQGREGVARGISTITYVCNKDENQWTKTKDRTQVGASLGRHTETENFSKEQEMGKEEEKLKISEAK